MGRIHEWGRTACSTVDEVSLDFPTYFELCSSDDEIVVRKTYEKMDSKPEFIVAPNLHDSRSNSVTGANIRRILSGGRPIAVMVTGKKRRERLDMCHWLIKNSYLPMFPRFMRNEANPAVPFTRHQLLHEMRPILDLNPEWIFVLHGFLEKHERVAYDYIKSTQNTWEILHA